MKWEKQEDAIVLHQRRMLKFYWAQSSDSHWKEAHKQLETRIVSTEKERRSTCSQTTSTAEVLIREPQPYVTYVTYVTRHNAFKHRKRPLALAYLKHYIILNARLPLVPLFKLGEQIAHIEWENYSRSIKETRETTIIFKKKDVIALLRRDRWKVETDKKKNANTHTKRRLRGIVPHDSLQNKKTVYSTLQCQ